MPRNFLKNGRKTNGIESNSDRNGSQTDSRNCEFLFFFLNLLLNGFGEETDNSIFNQVMIKEME